MITEISDFLLFLVACIVLEVGSYKGLSLWHGNMIGNSRNANYKVFALQGLKKALALPVAKESVPILGLTDMSATVDGVSDEPQTLTYDNSDIPKRKKDGVIKNFRSHLWSHVPWNATTETLLLEGVAMFGASNWTRVADRVGHGKTRDNCKYRYNTYLRNRRQKLPASSEWKAEDIAKLKQLVTKAKEPVWSDLKGAFVVPKIKWVDIGNELGRLRRACAAKWQRIERKKMGHFTPEEDELILQRVKEWGDRGQGLWVNLSEEMDRAAGTIMARWKTLERGLKNEVFWTDEMDAILLKKRESLLAADPKFSSQSTVDWSKVCDALLTAGYKVDPEQCRSRYRSRLQYTTAGLAHVANWTPEQVETLMQFREEGMSWTEIAYALMILPSSCRAKHDLESKRHFKRGPFSPEEDAQIREFVFDSEGRPSWAQLEKEMGRYWKSLHHRWCTVLYHKFESVFNITSSDFDQGAQHKYLHISNDTLSCA